MCYFNIEFENKLYSVAHYNFNYLVLILNCTSKIVCKYTKEDMIVRNLWIVQIMHVFIYNTTLKKLTWLS